MCFLYSLERRKWVVRCEGPRAGAGVWCRKEIGFQKVPPLGWWTAEVSALSLRWRPHLGTGGASG